MESDFKDGDNATLSWRHNTKNEGLTEGRAAMRLSWMRILSESMSMWAPWSSG